MQFLPSLLAVVVAVLFHFLLNHLTSAPPPQPEEPAQSKTPPSRTNKTCDPLHQFRLRPRPFASTCIRLIAATSETLSLQIRPPHNGNFTVFLQLADALVDLIAPVSITFPTGSNNTSVIYYAERLQSDTSYIAILQQRTTTCRMPVFTLPENNLVQNPSFETSAKPPFLATRFHEHETPRSWTPFYNGGAVRFCGPFVDPFDNTSVQTPRSGDCVLLLGPDMRSAWQSFRSQREMYYGAHQSVRIWKESKTAFVSAWYSTSSSVQGSLQEQQCKSCEDALSLVISVITEDGQWHDGAIVPLESSIEWTRVCIRVISATPMSSVHIFFHFHEHSRGHVLIDDVFVTENNFPEGIKHSTCHQIEIGSPPVQKPISLKRHLISAVRPERSQLTIAVPLTHDRILRLEAMSRLYGGGPVVAAVLVRGENEARIFEHIWQRKPYLRNHVDVSFVKWGAHEPALPINALRNVAIRLAQTEFVLMLDVDMTPATWSFECFRYNSSKLLRAILPEHEKRIAVLPVFITHIHHKPARDKKELLVQLKSSVGTSYCAHSQKANRIKRWYSTPETVETFFTNDYEPYGIARRDLHPMYDERFSGYGFNKISWTVAAARWGYSFLVLDDAFVTHLNHVENSWVSDINVAHYLVTWRRFLGFVSDEGSETDQERILGLQHEIVSDSEYSLEVGS